MLCVPLSSCVLTCSCHFVLILTTSTINYVITAKLHTIFPYRNKKKFRCAMNDMHQKISYVFSFLFRFRSSFTMPNFMCILHVSCISACSVCYFSFYSNVYVYTVDELEHVLLPNVDTKTEENKNNKCVVYPYI